MLLGQFIDGRQAHWLFLSNGIQTNVYVCNISLKPCVYTHTHSLMHSHTQCESLYVGNGDFCTLDQDGDTYPAIVLSILCEEGSTATYCIEDSCPDVPNTNQSDNSSCAGFSEASGTFCIHATVANTFCCMCLNPKV